MITAANILKAWFYILFGAAYASSIWILCLYGTNPNTAILPFFVVLIGSIGLVALLIMTIGKVTTED